MKNILKLVRLKQWIKNFFVFTPIIFSKHLLEYNYLKNSVLAFIAFCLVSSIVYIINDFFDKESDKLHPKKKDRPIASGKISIKFAFIAALIISLFALIIIFHLKFNFAVIIFVFFLNNLFYSTWFKHVVILDVFSIAGGYMLRVLGGAVVIDVTASYWLIICTLFFSLFLGFAKRRSEMVLNQTQSEFLTRKVLTDYSLPFLDQMLTITASGIAISYSLYTVSERTIKEFHSENLIYTTIFVLYGIFRYLYLLIKKNMGEDTAQVVLSDMPILLCVVLWLCTCVFILYYRIIF